MAQHKIRSIYFFWGIGLVLWAIALLYEIPRQSQALTQMRQHLSQIKSQQLKLPAIYHKRIFQKRLTAAMQGSSSIVTSLTEIHQLATLKNSGIRFNTLHWSPNQWTLIGESQTNQQLTAFLQTLKKTPPFNHQIATQLQRPTLQSEDGHVAKIHFVIHCGTAA